MVAMEFAGLTRKDGNDARIVSHYDRKGAIGKKISSGTHSM
jgi:hypothetical protein